MWRWQASGYVVVKADSLDRAVALATGCPVLKSGGEITVYVTFPPQGMKTNSSAPE